MKQKELTPEQRERRLHAQKYYLEHREEILAHNREYRQANHEAYRAKCRAYRANHKEHFRQLDKKYRQKYRRSYFQRYCVSIRQSGNTATAPSNGSGKNALESLISKWLIDFAVLLCYTPPTILRAYMSKV